MGVRVGVGWHRSLDKTHLVWGRDTPFEEGVAVQIECEHDNTTGSSAEHNQEEAQLVDEQGPAGRDSLRLGRGGSVSQRPPPCPPNTHSLACFSVRQAT